MKLPSPPEEGRIGVKVILSMWFYNRDAEPDDIRELIFYLALKTLSRKASSKGDYNVENN